VLRKNFVTTYRFAIFNDGNRFDPVEGAQVSLQPANNNTQGRPHDAVTDEEGVACIRVATQLQGDYHLTIAAADHETLDFPQFDSRQTSEVGIDLPLLKPAHGFLGWWHGLLGVSSFTKTLGQGISIGVIDSGCSKHPALKDVKDCGTVINSYLDSQIMGVDEMGHGTGVIGLLTACPDEAKYHGGMAPGATVYSIKAFDPHLAKFSTASQAEINEAIHQLVKKHVDLINCSFSSDEVWDSTEETLEEVYEQGTLCICAAGNDNTRVGYPGRSKRAIAVSAIGTFNAVSTGTLMERYMPRPRAKPYWQNDYFLATFSGRGQRIVCCGPGVGLVSTFLMKGGGEHPSQTLSGTSFAAPIICGALAAALAGDQVYRALQRGPGRADYALNKLKQMCQPLGFPQEFEGHGLPVL
jgi:subtilisin